MTVRLLSGDARDVLPTLPAESVQCCVTSPPYFGLRDYGTALWDGGDAACSHQQPAGQRQDVGREQVDGFHGSAIVSDLKTRQYRDTCGKCGAVRVDRQIGLERDPAEYLATMVGVFREVRRVLRRDGTCWVNMGDSYAGGGPGANSGLAAAAERCDGVHREHSGPRGAVPMRGVGSLAAKQLLLMPARLALALQADGWWVRSDIIWHKPNPMPESVTDRPTRSHEYVFLLTKSARYYYDQQGVAEVLDRPEEADRQTPAKFGGALKHIDAFKQSRLHSGNEYRGTPSGTRNARSVWTIATHAYSAAHFATFPPELAERCIKAGTRPGDTVLDPFIGAGTTALVADRLQRDCIGIDLNVGYTRMAMDRCVADAPLFTSFPPAEPPEDMRMADLFAEAAE